MTVTDALNTHNHSIDLIKRKGYEIYLRDEDEDYILHLKKGQIQFKAEDPLSLLSLVYLKEHNIVIHQDRFDYFMDENSSCAIKEISNKGFSVQIENNDDWYDWLASNNKINFFASSPLKLLGLILMIDAFGQNWQEVDVPLYLNDL